MQKNVQINEDSFIQDLGSGYSLVNFDRKKETVEEREVITAGEQYRVKNPATYGNIVNAVVLENYPDGAAEASMRKGIIDNADADFVAFNAFVESIKEKCKNEGI